MFKPRLEESVNPTHPLVQLAAVIDWNRLDSELGKHFFQVSAAALPTRLMAGLMYLQQEFNAAPEPRDDDLAEMMPEGVAEALEELQESAPGEDEIGLDDLDALDGGPSGPNFG